MSVQSVERSFAILDAVAEEPCGLSDIARQTGLAKSTVARLMATLEMVGAVKRMGDRYQVGPAISRLAGSLLGTGHLISLVHPELERLVAATGEAAGMGVPDGDHVLYVVQLDSNHPVNVRDWTGTLAPMHTTPSGVLMLSGRSERELDRYLAGELVHNTGHTLTTPDAIKSRIARCRVDGFAWGKEEFYEGINSVAAPVEDARGSIVAAIDLFGPSYRFPGELDEETLGNLVKQAAEAVSASLR